jgi:hypothetical protein
MYALGKRVVRESTPQPRLLIYPSRVKLTLLMAGVLLFVVAGAFMVRGGGPAMTVLGVTTVAFFGSALPYFAYRLIGPRPSVIVDRTGIHDHASVACAGFIPWHEVRRYRSRLVGAQPTLAITVTDPVALLARVSAPRRLLMKANQRIVGTPVNLPQVGLPIKIDELGKELDVFRSASEARAADGKATTDERASGR